MTRPTLLLALVLSALLGCGEIDAAAPDYWGAVPAREMLEVPRPQFAFSGAVDFGAWRPDDAIQPVNKAVLPALELVDSITAGEVPLFTDSGMEWRTVPGASEAVVWRFVLENVHDAWSDAEEKPAQSWRYRLEVKRKMARDDAFRLVLEGTRDTPAGDWEAAKGSGTFRVDWRAACEVLDRATCDGLPAGFSADARFDLNDGRALNVNVEEVLTSPAGVTRHFLSAQGSVGADGTGTLRTSERYEFPAPNVLASARSMRWLSSGAGRVDYSSPWSSSDGTSGVARGVGCWGPDAALTYSHEEGTPSPRETGNASACLVPASP